MSKTKIHGKENPDCNIVPYRLFERFETFGVFCHLRITAKKNTRYRKPVSKRRSPFEFAKGLILENNLFKKEVPLGFVCFGNIKKELPS